MDSRPAERRVGHDGDAELDLREALLSQGEIEIDITAIMGEVKVIAPPALRIVCDGLAIMGEFKELHSAGTEDPGAPLIRIHGVALMGSVSVKTRLQGESSLAAWHRRKREQRG
ncbi:MAG TPA: LiaF domain-containing protein [Gemmatimonadaceae bacterium]|nr:LiaF domain-containing protein [Gemmatimonadaceae bacterium]